MVYNGGAPPNISLTVRPTICFETARCGAAPKITSTLTAESYLGQFEDYYLDRLAVKIFTGGPQGHWGHSAESSPKFSIITKNFYYVLTSMTASRTVRL